MIDIGLIKKIHFVGIGGIGMSALAQYFSYQQKQVSGSDRAATIVTEMLQSRRINVVIGQKAESLPDDAELLIYSDAVPDTDLERQKALKLGIPQLSYFEALGEMAKGKRTIAVAGTHGKTTTTGMITKILVDAGKSPTAVVGSIMKDFSSNFVSGDSNLFVVEACEYRRHMLHIPAEVLVVTNIEWDHTDFFDSFESYREAFRESLARVPEKGAVVTDTSLLPVSSILSSAKAPVIDYTKERVPPLALVGDFNIQNARAAKAGVKILCPDIPDEQIDRSLAMFQGTWRRFEYKGETPKGAMVYDDYGHHPTEVKATLEAARANFPDKHIIVAFHPHLYTRTRDLMEEFANAFGAADEVIVAPIFAAREEPIPGITNQTLAKKIALKKGEARALDSLQEIEETLSQVAREGDLIITMGAGDIYKVAEAIVTA